MGAEMKSKMFYNTHALHTPAVWTRRDSTNNLLAPSVSQAAFSSIRQLCRPIIYKTQIMIVGML